MDPLALLSAGIGPAPQAGLKPPATPEQIRSAAEQFEGLLLHQLLKSAASEEGGWLGTGEEDSAGLHAMDLAQQQFAAALAARGGLGLAQLVIPQLTGAAASSPVTESK